MGHAIIKVCTLTSVKTSNLQFLTSGSHNQEKTGSIREAISVY